MVRIFSNFDTKFDDKALLKAQEEFGEEHVWFIRRDRIYVIFKILLPTLLRAMAAGLLLLFVYGTEFGSLLGRFFQGFVWAIIGISWVMLAVVMTNKIIDYYMDFTIITPTQITTYDQTGIFTRLQRSLDIAKIKSIRVDKKGFLHSVFNYGSIVFFSEWDQKFGDITLNYISDPAKLSAKLWEILKLNQTETKVEVVTDE